MVDAEVRRLAADLRRRDPLIRRIVWFGSWIKGTFSPASDVDLCIVVDHHGKPPRERVTDYMPRRFSVGVDLFVYTEAEFDELTVTHPGWHKEILSPLSRTWLKATQCLDTSVDWCRALGYKRGRGGAQR